MALSILKIILILTSAIALCGCESLGPGFREAIREAMIRTMEGQRECDNTPVPMKWDREKREWVIDQREVLYERASCLPRSP